MSSCVDINSSEIYKTQFGGQDYDVPESSNSGTILLVMSSLSCCLLLISIIAIAVFYYYYYYVPQQDQIKTPTSVPVPAPLILA